MTKKKKKKKRKKLNRFEYTNQKCNRRKKPIPEQVLMLEREVQRLENENTTLREVLYAVVDQDESRIRASVARAQAFQIIPNINRKYRNVRRSVEEKMAILNEAKREGPGYYAHVIRRHGLHPRTFYRWRNEFDKFGPVGLMDKWDRRKYNLSGGANKVRAVVDYDREAQRKRLKAKSPSPPLPEELVIPDPPNAPDDMPRTAHLRVHADQETRKVTFVGEPPRPRKNSRRSGR